MRKRLYTGLGHFLIDAESNEMRREVQVNYAIRLIIESERMTAFGHISGLNRGSKRLLLGSSVKLRLQNGNVIDVLFLGGSLTEDTARISVVSPAALSPVG